MKTPEAKSLETISLRMLLMNLANFDDFPNQSGLHRLHS
jgi:Fe-S-cluster formation regulator IscX/YfhJ